MRVGNQHQRIAVGRRPHGHLRRQHAVGAGPIVNDHGLTQSFGQKLPGQSRYGVGIATGRRSHYQPYGTHWIVVRRTAVA